MGKFLDLTGEKFERLLVLSRAEDYITLNKTNNKPQRKAQWNCVCDCGEQRVVAGDALRSNRQKSCGCYRNEIRGKESITHGKSNTSEFRSWKSMLDRCYNPNNKDWKDYGGRDIKVQDSWRNSFENFYNHLGEKPTPLHSLDRIDSNKNYEETNVKWSTPSEQLENTRRKDWHTNRYKYVKEGSSGCIGRFTYSGKNYYVKYGKDIKQVAIDIYNLYKQVVGHYPKYIDNDLVELGLIDGK